MGGLPTEEGVTVFTITASNAAGSTSFELTLRVVGLTCPALKDVPETAVGESYLLIVRLWRDTRVYRHILVCCLQINGQQSGVLLLSSVKEE